MFCQPVLTSERAWTPATFVQGYNLQEYPGFDDIWTPSDTTQKNVFYISIFTLRFSLSNDRIDIKVR